MLDRIALALLFQHCLHRTPPLRNRSEPEWQQNHPRRHDHNFLTTTSIYSNRLQQEEEK